MKSLTITVWIDDDVELDESAVDAIQSAAANEAYEQEQCARFLVREQELH